MATADRLLADAAEAYADALHWAVFPVWPIGLDGGCTCGAPACSSPGKHPAIRWRDGSTADPTRVRGLWRQRPTFSIGLDCGKSGVFVVDVDPRHGGDETLRDLQARHGQSWTDTVTALTGGGGQHLYFRNTANLNNSINLGPGIDARGVGGFVVLPPSSHASGRAYEWEAEPGENPIAELPTFIIEANARKVTWSPNGTIHEGNRNVTLTSLAGKLRWTGLSPEAIYAALRVQARLQCEHPETVSEAELRRMAHWVGKRPTGDDMRAQKQASEEAVHRAIEDLRRGS